MITVKNVVCGLALAGLFSATSQAATPDPMEKAVKARQGYMQVNAFNMGILAAMVKGEAPYDAEQAATAANNIKLSSMMKNKAMWVPGSGNDNPKLETKALPEIWMAGSDIGDKAKAFGNAASELAAVAGQGLDVMKPKFGDLGKSCKGCHKDYRAADKQ